MLRIARDARRSLGGGNGRMRPESRRRETNLSEKCTVPSAHCLDAGQQVFVFCIANVLFERQGCLGGFFGCSTGSERRKQKKSHNDECQLADEK